MKSVYFALPLILMFTHCKKKSDNTPDPLPTACFTPGNSFIGLGGVISFKNCSSNYDRVEWDFGDGQSSTISEPSHKWDNKGTYNVSLTVYKNNNSNKSSSVVHTGLIATGNLTCQINNIANPFPSIYDYLYYDAYLYRSSDLDKSISKITSWNTTINNKTAIITFPYDLPDNYSNYIVKLYMSYRLADSLGNGKGVRDSIITSDINILTGASAPTAAHSSTFGAVSYSLGPLSYK